MPLSASISMTVLLGSLLVVAAFVMQQPKEDPRGGPPTVAPVSGLHRCQMDALPSMRRILLGALNLQAVPRLPIGQLATIREQWRNTFNAIGHRPQGNGGSALSGEDNSPVEPLGVDNSTDLKCCQVASQLSLEALGWDTWVIYPESFTVVRCAPCDPNNVHCPPAPADAPSQLQCCEPTSEETVPVVYMDQQRSLVISSVGLTRTCGCGPGNPSHTAPNQE